MEDRALFEISLNLPKEFEMLSSDIIKWSTVLCTIHILNKMSDSSPQGWGSVFRMLLFASIGFSAYYLVIDKMLRLHFNEFNEGGSGDSVQILVQRLRSWIRERL
jgi:hypothetical protein